MMGIRAARHARILRAAAAYNVLWGAFIVLFPNALFDFADLARPNYPGIWQCVGMIVGVYGVGYWCASLNPYRHWPVVLVGFLGKIFGPIGFAQALYEGVFNWKFGLTIVTNDLIWWIPFYSILKEAYMLNHAETTAPAVREDELSVPLTGRKLFVLVRHSGCTFCRETLAELARWHEAIAKAGYALHIVHMGDPESGQRMAQFYGLQSAIWVSDPERKFYRFFGLPRGTLKQLFGLKMWVRGFQAGVMNGHGVGALEGDGFQMGGVVAVNNGRIQVLHRAQDAADIGDFRSLVKTLGS